MDSAGEADIIVVPPLPDITTEPRRLRKEYWSRGLEYVSTEPFPKRITSIVCPSHPHPPSQSQSPGVHKDVVFVGGSSDTPDTVYIFHTDHHLEDVKASGADAAVTVKRGKKGRASKRANNATSVHMLEPMYSTATSNSDRLGKQYISTPTLVTFPTEDGEDAHGFLYKPQHPVYYPLRGEKPPLLVKVRGERGTSTAT